MKRDWPVGETWRASFILAVVVAAAAPARGDARAIVVAARTQDPARLDEWRATLATAATADERAAAAFALGQLGVAWEPPSDETRARAEAALVEATAKESDAAVRERVLEALGKIGGRASLAPLRAALDGGARVRAAVALAMLAKNRALTDAAARARLETMLSDRNAEARGAAALALLRYHDPASRAALRGCTKDVAVHVRATCAKALADVGRDDDAEVLAPIASDAEARVAAEAARTLVKLAGKCSDAGCRSLRALQDLKVPWRPSLVQAVTFEHWRGMAAAALLRAAYDAAGNDATLDERTRAIVACKLAMAHDRASGRLELVRSCGGARVDERERGVWMAAALADGGGPELAKLAASLHAAVREAAAEGADAATTKLLLADADPPVVAAAAERAEKLALADAAPQIVAALARVRGPDAVEAQQALLSAATALKLAAAIAPARALVDAEPYALRQAAAHALTALTGTPTTARLPSLPSTPPPKLAPTIVRLRTTRGTIRARLWVDDAPRTAANFIALARKRFYDKLTFHRVVPDFVSQGGDPRGDGAGGPGYMIPCEIGMRRYGEGVLGMALSGRDTGGSQFFFTHAPEPHLDGRYTAFGEVVSGLDVVATLVEGDVILELTVE
ncbi:MAG TPA: peptidylprolyl isomerase [Polyangia bacterium]|nr:peptidylprolyl isomerase [Polyangia bacterium]